VSGWKAGDRYRFAGLEGEADPLFAPTEITIQAATWDGQVLLLTVWGSRGKAERALPVSDVAKMIELGIWEPLAPSSTDDSAASR
jgi:hypothetical protein